MTRLFVSLFISVVVVIMFFLTTIEFLPEKVLRKQLQQTAAESYQGTVALLDKRIQGLDARQRDKEIKNLKKLFEYNVDLVSLENLDLKPDEKQELKSDKFLAFMEDDADHLYALSVDSAWAWKLQSEQTTTEDYQRLTAGTRKLLEKNLAQLPEYQWSQEIEKLNRFFGFPVSLLRKDETELDEELLQRVLKGETIGLNYEEHNEQYYFRIAGSDYILKAGPIPTPFILRYFVFVVLAFLAGLMGFALWLWLRPVWRDMQGLHLAAEEFGQGRLDTRIEAHKRSPVKMIVDSFNAMATRIEQLISSHKELTNAVSHELRTPVARLRFSLDMLEKTTDKADRQRYIDEMNTDIEELDDLLGELLSYARVERLNTKLEYSSVELQSWFDHQVERYTTQQEKIAVEGISDSLPPQPVQCMEPKLMARALGNLVQNACRYARKHVYLNFSIDSGNYQLSVDDDGTGIPEDARDDVFEAFTRLDSSRNRESGGYGLGLAIVRRIAEWHDGEVQVMDSSMGGARFVIRWPV